MSTSSADLFNVSGKLPVFSTEYLRLNGIEKRMWSNPFYSEERYKRHLDSRGQMAYLYMLGATVINEGLLIKTDQFLEILEQIPHTDSSTTYERGEKNLVQTALIARIALDRIKPDDILEMMKNLQQDCLRISISPSYDFELPNGSIVSEQLVGDILKLYILANREVFPDTETNEEYSGFMYSGILLHMHAIQKNRGREKSISVNPIYGMVDIPDFPEFFKRDAPPETAIASIISVSRGISASPYKFFKELPDGTGMEDNTCTSQPHHNT